MITKICLYGNLSEINYRRKYIKNNNLYIYYYYVNNDFYDNVCHESVSSEEFY